MNTNCTRATLTEAAREIPVLMEADVVVVGGGTTGPVAAIAAARRGKKVVLIERFGSLGGARLKGGGLRAGGFFGCSSGSFTSSGLGVSSGGGSPEKASGSSVTVAISDNASTASAQLAALS